VHGKDLRLEDRHATLDLHTNANARWDMGSNKLSKYLFGPSVDITISSENAAAPRARFAAGASTST
jgi:hypothetical protein